MPDVTTLQHLTKHVYWYTPDGRTDRPSLAAVVGEKGTLMLDVGASPAHTNGFLDALAENNILTPRYAALTHWHWDHSFGASALSIPIIAHVESARQLKIQSEYDWDDEALDQRVRDGLEIEFCRDMIKVEMPDRSDLKLVMPDVLFTDTLTIDLGDVTCELLYVGGDHAADSVVMYVPEDRVLFMGDCLYSTVYASPRYYTVEKTRRLLAHIDSMPADHYILGHHDAVQTPDMIRGWLMNLRVVGDAVERYGANRDAVILSFVDKIGRDPDEDDLEVIESFLAGVPV